MTLASLFDFGAAQSWNAPLVLLLIKATLILVAALGITLAMQRASAGARHLVWLVTLGALVLIPALTAWAPLRLEILPAAAIEPNILTPLVMDAPTSTGSARVVLNAPTSASAPSAVTSAPVAPSTSAHDMMSALRGASLWSIALGLWAVIAAAIVLSLTWSSLVVRRLVRRSRALDDPSWMTPLYEVSDRMGLQEPPRLLLSPDAKMPFACGLVTPTIVLPAECESWSHERRLAVLLHELAHVRRRDLVGHTLGRLVCAAYWFHPLAWTAARQLRAESERACDDLALSCGTRATDYAEHLLDIVTSVRRETTPMVALAMARRKEFEGRMLAILDPELRHSTPSRRQSATLIGALAVISILVGAATPAPASARQAATRTATPDTTRAAIVISSPAVSDSVQANLDVANDAPRHARMQERTRERVAQRTSTSMSTATSTATSNAVNASAERAGNALGGLVSTVIEKVVPGAVSAGLDAGARALRVTAQDLMQDAPKGSKAADERAALLAKVLRSDTSAALRRVAAWGLAEYAEENVAVEALTAAVRRDANDTVREMAAWSLGDGSRENPAVGQALAAALKDANVRVRRTAAWSLGQIGDKSSVDVVIGALSDADADVRARAVWALGEIGPKQAPKQLVAMLSDKDEHVRELTAWALYEIEDPTSAPALQTVLRTETNKELQLKYIRALAAMGEKSVDAIRPLLESSDPQVKSMAVHALAGGHATGPWPHPWPQPRPYP